MAHLQRASAIALLLAAAGAGALDAPPVVIGLDLEFGHKTSTSDDAVRRGVLIAVDEINRAGGVLGGRPLAVVERDHRSVPARGVENVRELAAVPDLVAIFCGKFSPVVLEELPILHELQVPLLSPWAAADGIIDHRREPSFTFRLSLRDGWVGRAMVRRAERKGLRKLGVLLPATAWGRSNEAALVAATAESPVAIVQTRWYNWGVTSLAADFESMVQAGAEAIILIGNEVEGSLLVKEMAALPKRQQRPIMAHHGVMGGDLPAMTGPDLAKVDLVIAQPFFFDGRGAAQHRVLSAARRLFGIEGVAGVVSPAGLAAAYDLTHLLARAVDRAGTTSRPAVREALERLGPYDGVVRRLQHPFTSTRHEALAPEDVRFGRFDAGGVLVPER